MKLRYMDDGSLSDRTRDGVFTISSGFCQEDLDRIRTCLDSLCLDVEVKTYSEISIICINNKVRFYEMIGRHIHPSMMYKIPRSLKR